MIYINEWLPNPLGTDAKGEFIELFNNGDATINLSGWHLKTSGKKSFALNGYDVEANGYLVLFRSNTKLTLKNKDEKLFLYDQYGKLADQSSFMGSAQEGESLSRINYATDTTDHFAWSNPTPNRANDIALHTELAMNQYPTNIPLNGPLLGLGGMLEIMIGLGVALGSIMFYALKQDNDLSELFFGRDEAVW